LSLICETFLIGCRQKSNSIKILKKIFRPRQAFCIFHPQTLNELYLNQPNISPEREEYLLNLLRENPDPEMLGELYAPYMHLVYGVCLKYFKDREKAKDGVMEIFEKLLMELPRNEVRNFKPWLYVITKNFCLMTIRSEKTKTKKQDDFEKDQQIFMESEQKMHPVDEDQSEMNEALQKCIEKLKEEQKECIRLFYYENKCYQEVSSILNMDEQKVKSHLQNGKRNLKICLEGKN